MCSFCPLVAKEVKPPCAGNRESNFLLCRNVLRDCCPPIRFQMYRQEAMFKWQQSLGSHTFCSAGCLRVYGHIGSCGKENHPFSTHKTLISLDNMKSISCFYIMHVVNSSLSMHLTQAICLMRAKRQCILGQRVLQCPWVTVAYPYWQLECKNKRYSLCMYFHAMAICFSISINRPHQQATQFK